MANTVVQLLLLHLPFRRKLCEKLSIDSGDIDDIRTDYDRTIENEESWFSLRVVCKSGPVHTVTTRRLPGNYVWEFKNL